MLSPQIHSYLNEKIRKLCEESGHVCPFWVNEQIYKDLKWLDQRDEGDRAETYYYQCHSPILRYRPVFDEMPNGICSVECRRNEASVGNYYGDECRYCNDKVAEIMKKEFANGFTDENVLQD